MNVVTLPWRAWYEDTTCKLTFPPTMAIDVLEPRGGDVMSRDEVAAAIHSPIASPRLRDLASGQASACIVVDDLARPTQAAEILAVITDDLLDAGIPRSKTSVVIATGSHGTLSAEEMRWKVGSHVASHYSVQCHDCRSGLAKTGLQYGDRELEVNRTFLSADVKIAIGSVLPHSFAGFSGGAKTVLPGLADLHSISRSHKFVQLGLRGGTNPNDNGFRLEAEQITRRLGLDFVVCVVTDSRRETIGAFAGDVVQAHRATCTAASRAFATPLTRSYDCAVLNAYPKDCDLIQSSNSFVAWKTAKRPVVNENGLVILATAATKGVGAHGLFDPDGINYRKPGPLRHLRNRDLWILAPGIPPENVHRVFWHGYQAFNRRTELEDALRSRLPANSSIAVFPCAPMQQVIDDR